MPFLAIKLIFKNRTNMYLAMQRIHVDSIL